MSSVVWCRTSRRLVSKTAVKLGNQYKKISSFLKKASDKKLADYEKIKTLQEAQKAEEHCMNEIEELLNTFTR